MGLSLKSLTSSVLHVLRKSGKKVRENEIRYIEQLVGIYAVGDGSHPRRVTSVWTPTRYNGEQP